MDDVSISNMFHDEGYHVNSTSHQDNLVPMSLHFVAMLWVDYDRYVISIHVRSSVLRASYAAIRPIQVSGVHIEKKC